jgi:predicted nucleotidyltransferase
VELTEIQALRVRVLLAVQTALLGEVHASVRRVDVSWSTNEIVVSIVHDGIPDDDSLESARCVETELIASFPEHAVNVFAVADDSSRATTDARTVYARWERGMNGRAR